MLNHICGEIGRKMVSFWAKTSFKLKKKNPPIMEKVEAVLLLHDIIKTCVKSLKSIFRM